MDMENVYDDYSEEDTKEYMLSLGNRHIRATPLLEVFSVSIHHEHDNDDNNNNNVLQNGIPFEIYGSIHVTDRQGSTFVLYNRLQDEPEIVYLDDTLSLTGPGGDDWAIVPYTFLEVEVDLKDRARNIDVAKGQFSIDYTTKCDFEKGISKHVDGRYSFFASVQFTTYLFAVVATVEVVLFNDKKVDDGGSGSGSGSESDLVANVYGSIVARSNVQRPPDNAALYGKDYFSSMLFSKPQKESVRVKSTTPIKLSRSVVAVPAYSSLKIEVDLADGDTGCEIAKQVVEFQAQDFISLPDRYNVLGQGALIRVQVTWGHAYCRFLHETHPELDTEYVVKEFVSKPEKEESKMVEDVKEMPHALSDLEERPWSLSRSEYPRMSMKLLEVLSVFIGSYEYETFRVYGTIVVDDGLSKAHIYERYENCPEIMICPSSGSSTLSLADPKRSFSGFDFGIRVDLKDDVQGAHVVSKGFLGLNFMCIGPFYDKPICSVIRGDHGYAALHYLVFKDAVEAKLKVLFYNNGCATANVCGKLVGHCNNLDFTSWYAREYYRGVLFEKHQGNCLQLTSGSEIPLSRSVVCVAVKSSLVIEVELEASWQPNNDDDDDDDIDHRTQDVYPQKKKKPQDVNVEALRGIYKLKPLIDGGESSLKIKGRNCHIQVSVQWTDFPGEEGQ